MTTYDPEYFPKQFTKIDNLLRSHHHHLVDTDSCYFIGEYTARGGYAFSPTNNLIINLKKPLTKQGSPQWRFKARAIRIAAKALSIAMSGADLKDYTFIPAPSSKLKSDPMYDDRVVKVLQRAFPHGNLDFREAFLTSSEREAFHDNASRDPHVLQAGWTTNGDMLSNLRDTVLVFDDVLTTGCHFRAISDLLKNNGCTSTIHGIFLARRAPQTIDF